MNILLLAPQPFFQERGTPIAIKLLIETLCKFGHNVDLLTYYEGSNITLRGLRIFRIPKLPFIKNIPIGFSWKKIICDLFLSMHMIYLVSKKSYQTIHAVEESIYPALILRYFLKINVIYDMDSSMGDQLIEKWPISNPIKGLLYEFEYYAIRHSDVVVPMCQHLADRVKKLEPEKKVFVLQDIPIGNDNDSAIVENLREVAGVDNLMALYVGNLEHYQGIDLMLEAMRLLGTGNSLHLAIIGGNDSDINKYRTKSFEMGIVDKIHFLGPRPVVNLPKYLLQADILVSPRITGENTPMKIYSYLASGKPVLATNIASHTQVLDPSCALLVDPNPAALARGLIRLSERSDLRNRLGHEGKVLADTQYSFSSYKKKVNDIYSWLEIQLNRSS